jgi:DNA invertase Pin-like site-specific DNA recombinase
MLRELNDGVEQKPKVLIVTSYDRLARDIFDAFAVFGELRDADVKLHVRDGGAAEMHSPADAAVLFGRAFGGHAENAARSARMTASWERRRREGKPVSNKVPYGLQLRNEQDIPNPECAHWVVLAFNMYESGIGMSAIAKKFALEAPPSRTFSSRIGPDGTPLIRERQPVWEPNRVRKLLELKRYRGVLIPEALFDSVQGKMSLKQGRASVRRFEYPLSGAMKCRRCGRSYHGHATGGSIRKRLASGAYRTYSPGKRTRYYDCTVCRYRINADNIERAFLAAIGAFGATSSLLETWSRKDSLDALRRNAVEVEIARLRTLLRPATIEKQRRRAWELSSGRDPHILQDLPRQLQRIAEDESTHRARVEVLETELASLHATRRSVKIARGLLEDFGRLYDLATYDERREMCASVCAALGGLYGDRDGLHWPIQEQEPQTSRRRAVKSGTAPRTSGWSSNATSRRRAAWLAPQTNRA